MTTVLQSTPTEPSCLTLIRQVQTEAADYLDGTDVEPCDVPQEVWGNGMVVTQIHDSSESHGYVVERYDIPPNTAQDFHSHAEPKSGHVVSGVIRIETIQGGRNLRPFETWHLDSREMHRFVTTSEPASLIVVRVVGHPAHGRMIA